ncbi:MAG: AarF/ABC1/UbiB kinase family protein [Thermomicrobiales bacterium]
MITGFIVHRRHAARYREIVRIMLAHGLGGLVAPVGRFRRWTASDMLGDTHATDEVRAHHLRLALEELGPAFIKLGQILATRVDLLPPVYIAELERLQDRIAPDPPDVVAATIERELGMPPDKVFAAFDLVPLAVASLGQVHAATLHSGKCVVVKVQRHGVAAQVNEDVAILLQLAASFERRSRFLREQGLVDLANEFAWTIRAELDFLQEARMCERIGLALESDQTVRIPEIDWRHSTTSVLTMDRVDGIRVDDVEAIRAEGFDTGIVAANLVRILAFQILDVGVFHADPHPGNIVVCADGVIGMYDFGLVGVVDDPMRERLLFLVLAAMERHPQRVVDEIMALGAAPPSLDRKALEREVSYLMTHYIGVRLDEIPMMTIADDIMHVIRRYHLRLPGELAMLAKTAVITEAVARRLDPEIDVIAVAQPAIRRAGIRFYSPEFWWDRLKGKPLETALLVSSLPATLQRFITRFDRNDFKMHIQIDDITNMLYEMNSMVNRLVMAVLAAALSIGVAILVLAIRPSWTSFEGVLLTIVFAVAMAITAGVVFRVWRSGRR